MIKNQRWNSWSSVRSPSHVFTSSLLNHYSVFTNYISAYLCQNTNICLSLYVCSQTPSHPSTSHRTICHPHVICPLSYLELLIHLEWHKYVPIATRFKMGWLMSMAEITWLRKKTISFFSSVLKSTATICHSLVPPSFDRSLIYSPPGSPSLEPLSLVILQKMFLASLLKF